MTFLDKGFKFQPYVCNGSNNLLMMSKNLSGIAIVNIQDVDYCCIISGISKCEPKNVMQNIDMTEKSENYKAQKFFITDKNRSRKYNTL